MTIYDTNKDGEIIVLYDSRWQFPEIFGYKPEDPQYRLLRRLWEKAKGGEESEEEICEEN